MGAEIIIGIDIGTQGTKAALFSGEGECLSLAFRKSRLYRSEGGVVEEDPEYQLSTVCQTIKECVKTSGVDPREVAAIGIDGQMAGIIGIGEDGRNITPYDSWLDTRCHPYIEYINNKAGEEVLRKTGNIPSFNHGPKILWWMNERKSVFKRIKSFVQPAGYVAIRLCGLNTKDAFVDRTYLHFSGFADNQSCCWDKGLCKEFKLDESKLPHIVEPEKIVGHLTSSMAKRCGLKSGVPIIAGCGDTAASFLACGATEEGVCVDVSGTASVFAATVSKYVFDKNHRTLGCGQAVTKGLWHPYAYINGGGMNLEWFKDCLANRGQTSRDVIGFDELNNLAEKLPVDGNGPLFVPHFAGRVCPASPDLRGAWIDLDWNCSLAHMYRSILESVVFEYAIYMKVLKEICDNSEFKEIRITGGGEKSLLWNKIKASVLKMPVVQINQNIGAPLGTAMLAGFAVGLFESLPSAARKLVCTGKKIRGNSKVASAYELKVKRYEKVLESLIEIK